MAEDQNRTLQDKFMLRLPEGMREQIRSSADALGRSMNAEIIQRLKRSLEEDQDDRFERVYIPRSIWSMITADAHLRDMSDTERLFQIIDNAFSNTPDLELTTDKLYDLLNENVRVTDDNSLLRQETDVTFALYFGKIVQLSQLAKLILTSKDKVPEPLRTAAEDVQALNDFELGSLENRNRLAEGRQALRENRRNNAADLDADIHLEDIIPMANIRKTTDDKS